VWEREAGETGKVEKCSMKKKSGRRGRGNEIEVKEDNCLHRLHGIGSEIGLR